MALKLLLAPHHDDESLFAAYTVLRQRPLVVVCTDSWVQFNRGDGITNEQRMGETQRAMELLGAPVLFLGVRDDTITEDLLMQGLQAFPKDSEVWAPSIQGGHVHHDLVGHCARRYFETVVGYTTYTKSELYTTGDYEVLPTPEEAELKNKALDCYESQLKINGPHFEAVRNKSEWLNFT